MADAFISYSRKDKEFVRRLEEALEHRGRETWVDWEGIRPTEEFMRAIYGAIEAADTFVFVLTPESVASVVCAREIAHAAAHNKRMVPLVGRDVSAEAVPETLAKLNWIFCRDADDFAKAIDTLITAFDTDLEWVHGHTRLLTRAIEWNAKGRNDSFVLRKDDLRDAERWLTEAGADKERQPTPLQTEYILASRKAAARTQQRILIAVFSALVIAALLAGVALYQWNLAEQRQRVAQARQLEAQARVSLDSSGEGLQRSALLAVESLKSAWTLDGYIACSRAMSLQPRRPEIRQAHERKVLGVTYSADGRLLATQDQIGNVIVWENGMGKTEISHGQLKRAREMQYAGLIFSPDGKWLVSTSGGHALVWDAATWQIAKELPHGEMVWSVAFSASGHLMATASYHSPQVKVYSTANWEEPNEWRKLIELGTSEACRALAFSPNGQWLAVSGSSSLTIWEISTPKELKRIASNSARSIAFSPDSQTVAIGGSGLRLCKLEEMENDPLVGHSGEILDVAFSRDGRYLASAGSDETVRIWNVATKRELLRLPQKASAIAFAPEGTSLVTGNDDGTIAVWPLSRGTSVKTLPQDSLVKAVAFSPDGQSLAIGSVDGLIRILKTGDWSQLASKQVGEEILTIGLSPYGPWLMAITDRSARLFSMPRLTEASPHLELAGSSVQVVSFSPDGKWFAIQQPAQIREHAMATTTRVFELVNMRLVGTRSEVKGFVGSLSSKLPTEGDLKLAESAASWPAMRLGGKSDKSSDGRWETVHQEASSLIDAQMQRPADVVQHTGKITDAVFSPDGRWLVTASDDQTVRVWPMWTEDLLPEAMRRLQRNLTFKEWQESFDNQPYSKTCPDLPAHPSLLEKAKELAARGDFKAAAATFRRLAELEPSLKLDPDSELRKLAEDARQANAAKTAGQESR